MHHIALSRAIGTEFLLRKYKSLRLTLAIAAAIVLLLLIWLTTVNIWWWFLAAPGIVVIMLGAVLLLFVRVLIRLLSPTLSQKQDTAVKGFVDKLERVADNIQMPPFMIVFQVIRDIIRPRNPTFIKTVVDDSSTLHADFAKLTREFND